MLHYLKLEKSLYKQKKDFECEQNVSESLVSKKPSTKLIGTPISSIGNNEKRWYLYAKTIINN